MEDQPSPKRGIPFRTFINDSVNLLTVFGIFNALTVYSIGIDQQIAMALVTPVFMVLSIIVWWQLMLFTMESNEGSKVYDFFICSLVWLN